MYSKRAPIKCWKQIKHTNSLRILSSQRAPTLHLDMSSLVPHSKNPMCVCMCAGAWLHHTTNPKYRLLCGILVGWRKTGWVLGDGAIFWDSWNQSTSEWLPIRKPIQTQKMHGQRKPAAVWSGSSTGKEEGQTSQPLALACWTRGLSKGQFYGPIPGDKQQ